VHPNFGGTPYHCQIGAKDDGGDGDNWSCKFWGPPTCVHTV